MLKQALAAGAIVATALVVPLTMPFSASASTAVAPASVVAATSDCAATASTNARCKWRWSHGRYCKWCKHNGKWERDFCKMNKNRR